MELTQEQRDAIIVSKQYEELRDSPGWKRISVFMYRYADRALAAMRNSKATDPMASHTEKMAWRERENFIAAIESEIAQSIEARKEIVSGMLVEQGARPDQIDQILQEEGLLND